ncbi:hypothetical protein [Actinocrispum sp. NPDC049592]|uniref:hypothetical protein n=1 Tax=Actinocrispum sp. NPDC049592 TaxID=3154835 RepID=UPI003439D014
MARRTQRALRAAALAVISIGGLMAGTAPANAGASCSLAGCSTTVNDSSVGATAMRNWCWDGNSSGDSTETYPGCTVDNVPQSGMFLSAGGGHTPRDQDWDVLRVDAGWCYKVFFNRLWVPSFTRTYDRRGRSELYVKVGDEAIAHIKGQSTSSCP